MGRSCAGSDKLFIMQAVLIRLSQTVLVLLLGISVQLQCDFECLTSLVAPAAAIVVTPAAAVPPCHHQADNSGQPAHHESNPEKNCDRHATGDQAVITAKAASPVPAFVAVPVATTASQIGSVRRVASDPARSESTNSSRIEPPLRI
jgi:hypothetical protein